MPGPTTGPRAGGWEALLYSVQDRMVNEWEAELTAETIVLEELHDKSHMTWARIQVAMRRLTSWAMAKPKMPSEALTVLDISEVYLRDQ
jgi:hypothetical protein